MAGRAALEVGTHARDPVIGFRTVELELDVFVELLEALVAEQLGLGGAEQLLDGSVVLALVMISLR